MTMVEMEKRLKALEETVEQLRTQVSKVSGKTGLWWREGAGRFANDPVFDEIVRLGKQYRDSLHPDWKEKQTEKTMRNRNL
jgi:hypothetical protein